MNDPGPRLQRFFEELKHRRVFRATAVYVVVAIGVVEVANNVFPHLLLPPWTVTLVVALAVLGLPVTVALSWAFDIRPSHPPELGTEASDAHSQEVAREAGIDRSAAPAPQRKRTLRDRLPGWTILAVVVVVLAWLMFGIRDVDESPDDAVAPVGQVSGPSGLGRSMVHHAIAVLPFENISPDPEAVEWFVYGVREEISDHLIKLGGLTVRPPETVRRVYGDGGRDLAEMAAELQVPALLMGSVRIIGDRFRLIVRLVDVAGDTTLWQDTYDGDYTTGSVMFDTQSAVAERIAFALGVEPLPARRARVEHPPTANAEAWILYRQGRFQENKTTPEAVHRAIDLYNQAIEQDPGFGHPYAGIASAYTFLAQLERWPPEEYVERLAAAAERALDIDSTLAEPYRILGEVKAFGRWDFFGAERDFDTALRLEPNAAMVHTMYAQFLDFVDRHEDAIAHMRRAQEIDPVDPFIAANLAGRYYFARQYDLALAEARRALELDPGHWVTHWIMGWTYSMTGDYDDAIEELDLAAELSGGAIEPLPALAFAYAQAGQRAEARQVLRQLSTTAETEYVAPSYFAFAYAGFGETDPALDWLETAYEGRDTQLLWVLADPMLDGLRSHPRFRTLVNKIGLSDYIRARADADSLTSGPAPPIMRK
jgi:adenylate cyclase